MALLLRCHFPWCGPDLIFSSGTRKPQRNAARSSLSGTICQRSSDAKLWFVVQTWEKKALSGWLRGSRAGQTNRRQGSHQVATVIEACCTTNNKVVAAVDRTVQLSLLVLRRQERHDCIHSIASGVPYHGPEVLREISGPPPETVRIRSGIEHPDADLRGAQTTLRVNFKAKLCAQTTAAKWATSKSPVLPVKSFSGWLRTRRSAVRASHPEASNDLPPAQRQPAELKTVANPLPPGCGCRQTAPHETNKQQTRKLAMKDRRAGGHRDVIFHFCYNLARPLEILNRLLRGGEAKRHQRRL